jgi:hypothetical protein
MDMQLTHLLQWPQINGVSRLYTRYEWAGNSVATILLVITATLLYQWYIKSLSEVLPSDERRLRTVKLRNRMTVVTVLLLYLLWSTEIRTLTVSMGALAVAFVLATKEMILSVVGGVVRTTTRRYVMGDRIAVKGIRGDVLDITLLYTILMELDNGPYSHQYTGNTVVIPNSVLITDTVAVEATTQDHALHNLKVPVYPEGCDIAIAISNLRTISNQVCEPYLAEAEQHLRSLQIHTTLDMTSAEPRVTVYADSQGKWWLTLRCMVPLNDRVRIDQDIIQGYLKLQQVNFTTTHL